MSVSCAINIFMLSILGSTEWRQEKSAERGVISMTTRSPDNMQISFQNIQKTENSKSENWNGRKRKYWYANFLFFCGKKSTSESLAMLRLIGSMGNFGTKARQPGSSLCSLYSSSQVNILSKKLSLWWSSATCLNFKFTFL